MKKYIFSFVLALCTLLVTAQTESSTINVRIGDTFEIGKVDGNSYEHINFPKDNFIIKRGGIASYKKIAGSKIMVESVDKKADGSTVITIKQTNGNRFFGSHNTVSVDFDGAIKSAELIAD